MYQVSMLYAVHFKQPVHNFLNWLEYDGKRRNDKNITCVAKKTNMARY